MAGHLFRKTKFPPKGFTLIELLIVIAIIGILAAGILVAIDPVDKIRQANDAKVKNDISATGRATEAYTISHNGYYPATFAQLVTAGELKRVPVAPSGYTGYTVTNTPTGCTAGVNCTKIVVRGRMYAKNTSATQYWIYESSSGKSCAVATTSIVVCP